MTKIQPLTPRPKVDWEAVERLYRTTLMGVREIAATHGTKPSTVQSRARAGRWVRGANASKRQIITDAQAGILPGMKPDEAKRSQEKAIKEDLEDMNVALTGHRRAARLMQQALDMLNITDPLVEKKAKVMVETIEKSVDGIRRIRGLDDPKKNLTEDETNAIVAQLLGAAGEPHTYPKTAGS